MPLIDYDYVKTRQEQHVRAAEEAQRAREAKAARRTDKAGRAAASKDDTARVPRPRAGR